MRLSTRRLFFLILLMVLFFLGVREVTDPDFWWHLRAGQYIFETRSIPHTDIFSFTFGGREWVTHEWLSEVIIYAIFKWLGWGGLVTGFALIATAAFALSYHSCERRGAPGFVSWVVVLLGALATAPVLGVRPQMFSLFLTSVFLFILTGCMRAQAGRSLWLLPPLMLLWVNLHAGYVLGLVLITITLAGITLDGLLEKREPREILRRARPLIFVLAACVVMVPLNPNGLRLFTYPFETLASSAMQENIEEWFSPNFHQARFLPLAVLMFATFAALALSTKRLRVSELMMLCATAYAVLRSGRHLPIFAFAALPLLAEHAALWIKSQDWASRLFAPEKAPATHPALFLRFGVLALALAVTATNVRQVIAGQPEAEERNFPARAVAFLSSQKLPDPIFNSYDWGGYLIWKLYPERRIYIDGRADVYGDAFMKEFLRASRGQGDWREPLSRNGIRTVIVKADSPLAGLLAKEEGWSKAFEDNQAVVLVKR